MKAIGVTGEEFLRATQVYDSRGLIGLIEEKGLSAKTCAVVVNIATFGGTLIQGVPVVDYIEMERTKLSQ